MGIKSGKLRRQAESRGATAEPRLEIAAGNLQEEQRGRYPGKWGSQQSENKGPGLEREARPVEHGGIFMKRVVWAKS